MAKKTLGRLEKVIFQVDEWSSDSLPPYGWLESYIGGGVEIALANVDLFKHGMAEIKAGLVAASHNMRGIANQHMSHGISRMLFSEMTGLATMRDSDQLIINGLDGVTHMFLAAIATGQQDVVRPFYNVVLAAFDGGYGVHDGRSLPIDTTLRYSAFGLSIISDWLGQPLDLDAHALPRDPAWGQLVAHWREPDPDRFLQILLQACDTHVERIAVTEREANALSKNFEFNSVFLAVHPTEILAILRLRDLLGLPNPFEINHPLMQTPYAAITCLPGEVTERDELLERYLATVRQRDPHVLPPGF